MNTKANAAVQRAIDTALSEHGELGLQVAAYHQGRLVVDAWGGIARPQTGEPMDGNTLICPFSVTKAVTATALHIQAERGLVDYATPIAKYWPEFGVHGKERGTVYDALTHRLGLPFMPADVDVQLMCNWAWMTTQLAKMHPLFEPGTRSAYMSLTFGWVIGEIVRRTDPKQRAFSQFVAEEICAPLAIDSLWLGAPESEWHRVAALDAPPEAPVTDPSYRPDNWRALAHPPAVQASQGAYALPQVWGACLPGSGALMNARSGARLFAMLAGRGTLDGVRLLSASRVSTFHAPRPPVDWDMTLGAPHRGSVAGFWLRGTPNMAPVGTNPCVFGHPGFGGSVGWADPEEDFAMAIFHNRLYGGGSSGKRGDGRALVMIAEAARRALGVIG